MAENSDETAGGDAPRGRPFAKGTSGNPGGRPKGLAKKIRGRTKNGLELVEFALAVLRADVDKLRPSDIDDEEWAELSPAARMRLSFELAPSIKERLTAAQYLTDRGWGKATEKIELSGPEGGPIETKGQVKSDVPDPERMAAIAGLLAGVGALATHVPAAGTLAAPDTADDAVHPAPALSPAGGVPPSSE